MYNRRITSLNSPLSPITPLEGVVFNFSPTITNSGLLRRTSTDSTYLLSPDISPLFASNSFVGPRNSPSSFSVGNNWFPNFALSNAASSQSPTATMEVYPKQVIVIRNNKKEIKAHNISEATDASKVDRKPSPKPYPREPSQMLPYFELHGNATARHNAHLNDPISVDTILDGFGLGYLSSKFYEEEIDLNVFFSLTEEDLCAIGVVGNESSKIMNFINSIKM